MRPRGLTGYADLVRLGGDSSSPGTRDLARMFGYRWVSRDPGDKGGEEGRYEEKKPAPSKSRPSPHREILAAPLLETPFFRLEAVESIVPDPVDEGPTTRKSTPAWRKRPSETAEFRPLASWRDLDVRLRHALCDQREGNSLDIDRIVARIGAGEVLDRLPRKPLSHWNEQLQIIADRSWRLTPYFHDQNFVAALIRRSVPDRGFWPAAFREGRSRLVSFSRGGREEVYRLPSPGTSVLVMGDLGTLAAGDGPRRFWLDYGFQLRAAGCRPVALFPAALKRCPKDLADIWTIVPWERPDRQVAQLDGDPGLALLRLVSPASRVEPGLLRAVRRLMGANGADAGMEADVWRNPWLESRSPAAAVINSRHLPSLRHEFTTKVPEQLRREVVKVIRAWRANLPEEIWFDELINLDPEAQAGVPIEDLEDARDYMRVFAAEAEAADGGIVADCDRAWLARNRPRATPFYWGDPEVGRQLMRLDFRLNRGRSDYRAPTGFDPGLIAPPPGAPEVELTISQEGGNLQLSDAMSMLGEKPFIPIGALRSRNRIVTIEATDDRNAFWKSGTPPSWADDWGVDAFGAWVTFSVKGVTQKMRWIEPGTFRMGSPADEPGRFDDEGPQHEVTISRGFWLFDTACTQELFEAAKGEDGPRRRKRPKRPVVGISWNDVQEFLGWINGTLPDLDLGLPTEAQWEYACRAGTTTPYSFGATITSDQVNFDRTGETVDVATLPPNPWGLYEMHGNVSEWCEDNWHDTYGGAPADGGAWVDEAGGHRVLRGGSWILYARYVRAACRDGGRPDSRAGNLGFRCARVQGLGAELAEPALPWQAERQGTQEPSSGATLLRLREEPERKSCELPRAPAFHIASDCERLTYRRLHRPAWADAMGRDRFGLWTEFAVGGARQRLRWIPPGRFVMGSPEDEPGRYDDEGPQHEVTIARGFWLADTPCPQALWQAVMGDNPSEFKSPKRPVETVSWNDVQEFLKRVNERVPGLGLSLPSEAQWEYACRAGTTTALYTGGIEILGTNNAPALDPIAWYGGNSGKAFDLDDGHDSTGWPEKQYPHEKAGTREVGLKDPNPWGLYDMLGNVWEWCGDTSHENYDGAPADGSAWVDEAGGDRVVRGGSWIGGARGVRAAYRRWRHPDFRVGRLGFRCARVHP